MTDEIREADQAINIAKEYADDNCIGEFDEVIDVRQEDDIWIIKFQTHTFADEYEHRVRITTAVGNVISHERNSRLNSSIDG